jgi:hypothetical protein
VTGLTQERPLRANLRRPATLVDMGDVDEPPGERRWRASVVLRAAGRERRLGGLFFIASALLAPRVELVRTARGRSSAAAWRAVGGSSRSR